MSYSSEGIERHKAALTERLRMVFLEATDILQISITEGHELTGAPGQPVQSGELKGSFIPSRPSPWVWMTVSMKIYGPFIEDGVGPHGTLTLRSEVGGFHSIKMTRAAWPAVVRHLAGKHGVGVRT